MTVREFSFPLNVYGALLEWTQGRLDHLHYGLFDSADEPVALAQERASERLWAQMPPPCRVLEVGIGVGTTLQRLRERGYDALGVTPEPAQAALARQRHGADLAVEIARLEDLGPGHGPFDLLLLQESAQYIEPLALFGAAERLLARERATLLVMDEFALHRDGDAGAGLHLLPDFVELARRFGWRLVHEEDVTAQARITLDMMLELATRNRQRLQEELGVRGDDLDALERSNRRYRDCYRRGVYGYRVLRFERGAPAGLLSETAAARTVQGGMSAAMAALWPRADQVLVVGAAPADFGGRRLQATELAGFEHRAGTWQALVLWKCAAQMDAIGIFSAAATLLAPAVATLLVSDRFVTSRNADDQGDCHQLAHFVALAERCGWNLSHRVEEAAGDRQVHAFLRFDRRPGPVDTLLRVDERSAPAMRELFRHVFGHEMSPEHWQWKYGEGRGVGVALARDGRFVAHFAGLSRRVLRFGAPGLAWQIGDVMVAPDANRALVRSGPLQKVSTTFIENEVGWGRSHRFGFGFPNERAFKVAERLGLYTAVDAVVRICWPARAAPGTAPACHWLAAGGRLSAAEADAVDACWRAMAPAFADAVLGVRDAAWLCYRYLERPHVAYRLARVQERTGGAQLGVIVLREHETHLDLLDMVGPPASFASLVGAARAHAAASGRQHVALWLTRSQLHRLAAADLEAAEVHDMGITVPANVHTPGPPVEELRDRWFLLGGDADFT